MYLKSHSVLSCLIALCIWDGKSMDEATHGELTGTSGSPEAQEQEEVRINNRTASGSSRKFTENKVIFKKLSRASFQLLRMGRACPDLVRMQNFVDLVCSFPLQWFRNHAYKGTFVVVQQTVPGFGLFPWRQLASFDHMTIMKVPRKSHIRTPGCRVHAGWSVSDLAGEHPNTLAIKTAVTLGLSPWPLPA